jgi:SAM-dependent methyltransferase
MFTLIENRYPTQESSDLIDKYSDELISLQVDPDDWREYLRVHRVRLCFDLDYVVRFCKPHQKILEIGALPYFLTVPLMNNYDMTTIDQDRKYSAKIVDTYSIKTFFCDLDYKNIPADDESFDGIIMNEVFEHLRVDLIFTMKEVLRVLQPRGILLLSTPNLRSMMGIYNLLFRGEAFACMGGIYENYSYVEKFGTMGHTREYTPTEVVDFLKKIGFEIDGVIYRGEYGGTRRQKMARYITKIWPQFKPWFSVVASKPSRKPENSL